MTENTKRRATGWTVDTLLIGLAIIVAIAFISTGRPARAAEACVFYDEQVLIGLAMGIPFGEVAPEDVATFLTALGVNPEGATRVLVVTGPEKMALGIERNGCLEEPLVLPLGSPPGESTAPSPTLDSTDTKA